MSGVLVTSVDADKPAAEVGLTEGMLILKVGKKSVKNIEEFQSALKGESLKDGVLLLVRTRSGGSRYVVVKG